MELKRIVARRLVFIRPKNFVGGACGSCSHLTLFIVQQVLSQYGYFDHVETTDSTSSNIHSCAFGVSAVTPFTVQE